MLRTSELIIPIYLTIYMQKYKIPYLCEINQSITVQYAVRATKTNQYSYCAKFQQIRYLEVFRLHIQVSNETLNEGP